MGVSRLGAAVVISFVALYLAIWAEVSVLMIQDRGTHTVNLNQTIVFSDSLAGDVESAQDVTSISQFSVETLRGMVTLAGMAIEAATLLLALGWGRASWITLVGYGSVALVGVFPTAVPGSPARRDYNPVLLWTMPDAATAPIHIAAAVAFLFVPVIDELVRRRARSWYWVPGLVNLGFVVAEVVAYYDPGSLLEGVWMVLEIIAFGLTFCWYAAHELLLTPTPAHTYARLPRKSYVTRCHITSSTKPKRHHLVTCTDHNDPTRSVTIW